MTTTITIELVPGKKTWEGKWRWRMNTNGQEHAGKHDFSTVLLAAHDATVMLGLVDVAGRRKKRSWRRADANQSWSMPLNIVNERDRAP